MRIWFSIGMLAGCQAMAPQGTVNTQEYVFVLNSGRSFMRVLPVDWQPRYEGAYMRIDPRHRVLGQDVVLFHPHFPIDPHHLEMARVIRNMPTRGAANYLLWITPGQELHTGDLSRTELEMVAPHTWLRPSEFRLEFRRPLKDR